MKVAEGQVVIVSNFSLTRIRLDVVLGIMMAEGNPEEFVASESLAILFWLEGNACRFVGVESPGTVFAIASNSVFMPRQFFESLIRVL